MNVTSIRPQAQGDVRSNLLLSQGAPIGETHWRLPVAHPTTLRRDRCIYKTPLYVEHPPGTNARSEKHDATAPERVLSTCGAGRDDKRVENCRRALTYLHIRVFLCFVIILFYFVFYFRSGVYVQVG